MWEGHQKISGNRVVIVGGTSKDFGKQDWNLWEMVSKCRDFLSEEYCEKLFYLIDCFWEAIADVDVGIVLLLLSLFQVGAK